MLDNKNISIDKLDHLMDQAFLHLDFNKPENKTIMEAISKEVMYSDTYASAGMKTGLMKLFSNKLFLQSVLISTIAFLALVVISTFFEGKKANDILQNGIITNSEKTAKPEQIQMAAQERPLPESNLPGKSNNHLVPVDLKDSLEKSTDTSVIDLHQFVTEPAVLKAVEIEKKIKTDTGYAFPKLTEKEIKENEKQKKKMIDQLIKFNKKSYALIPMGTFDYKGETISLQSFYAQTTEVTNLEYRTFLYDLLINNRKEEFLKAKPDQKQWMKEFNRPYFQPMVDNYFSHPAYDRHPVVSVSREGAQMYCDWLTIETNKILKEKNKPLINDLRIPTDAEWTYAAAGGNKDALYPWPGQYPRNAKGCFLANFCLKKYKGSRDSLSKCNNKKFKDAYTTAGYMLGEGNFTVWIDSYNPNNYGLYCMAGNVAEMVQVCESKTGKFIKHGTKGGGWNSDEEHIKINGEDEYDGKTDPSVFIGFRPVTTYKGTKIKVPF